MKRVIKHPMVKFPYSKEIINSIYKKDFKGISSAKFESFNLEKEAMKRPPGTVRGTSNYVTTARDAFKNPFIELKRSDERV